MRPLVEGLGESWEGYVTSPVSDQCIQAWTFAVGCFFVISGGCVWFSPRYKRWIALALVVGGSLLVLLSLFYVLEKGGQWPIFLEHSLQWGSPFFLLFFIRMEEKLGRALIFAMKIAAAATFIGHGLYALNIFPRPGGFVQMILDGLGVEETQAIAILKVAGILDFISASLIFLSPRWARIGLFYMLVWGAATAFARIVAHWHSAFWLSTLEQWTHEFIFRFPHFLIPLFLLLNLKKGNTSMRS